ncbi:MAG: orotidine-5'-phosphate decarboxylase [Spirochaetia bacterium]
MEQDTPRTYVEKLRKSSRENSSIVCVGLDPLPSCYPFPELPPAEQIVKTYEQLFEKMSARQMVPGSFKPNIGYYHRLDRPLQGDFSGSLALAEVFKLLREAFPETPVILDAKRGDIATSSANYAEEAFSAWEADAVTIAPYMGSDSTGPFLKWYTEGRGVYILNRTSNPGGRELQNLQLAGSNQPLYLEVADAISRAAKNYPGTGAVVGATNPRELEDIAAFYAERDIPLLIPGVGGQGGSAERTVQGLRGSGYPLELARINSSSGITHPWAKQKQTAPADWLQVCIDALVRLTEEIAYEQ